MPEDAGPEHQPERLADDVASTWARSQDVLARVVRAARMCAETEDKVAETLDHLAQTQPHRAASLQARSASARDHAAQERQWAEDHEPATGQGRPS